MSCLPLDPERAVTDLVTGAYARTNWFCAARACLVLCRKIFGINSLCGSRKGLPAGRDIEVIFPSMFDRRSRLSVRTISQKAHCGRWRLRAGSGWTRHCRISGACVDGLEDVFITFLLAAPWALSAAAVCESPGIVAASPITAAAGPALRGRTPVHRNAHFGARRPYIPMDGVEGLWICGAVTTCRLRLRRGHGFARQPFEDLYAASDAWAFKAYARSFL